MLGYFGVARKLAEHGHRFAALAGTEHLIEALIAAVRMLAVLTHHACTRKASLPGLFRSELRLERPERVTRIS